MGTACRILVLNFNGRVLLAKFLPSVIASARASRFPCKVTVIDNQSSDDSILFVKANFPEIDIFLASENRVLCSYNEAAAFYTEDVLIFLNNDIQTEEGFVGPLVRVLEEHSDAFFVSSYGDRSLPVFHRGILGVDIYYEGFHKAILKKGYSLSAGIGAFDRKKFLDLGGYDPMYLPGYYEDLDLCYRGWKKGYRGYYAPEAHQFHIGSASFSKKYKPQQLESLVFRNSVLFMLKNIVDPVIYFKFVFFLFLRFATALLLGKKNILNGFFEVRIRLSEALHGRRQTREVSIKTDREILALVRNDILRDCA